jgi:predicted NACHT family NTPase
MIYIDLFLSENGTITEESFTLNEILEQNSNIVVLGAPGSGKSTILKKYNDE